MIFRSGIEDPVSVSFPFWMWLWTGHQIVHLFGWNAGVIESRARYVGHSGAKVIVAGYRCTTCGRWEA